ncbi:MAG: diguanylate cyclase [Gammaproteobacteria bacterium]|nr:diguanylate cyclase [Gammaproteobacteria bacterium]
MEPGRPRRLSGSLRDGDIVSRLGGDEFAILLQNVDNIDVAGQLANTILLSLRLQVN